MHGLQKAVTREEVARHDLCQYTSPVIQSSGSLLAGTIENPSRIPEWRHRKRPKQAYLCAMTNDLKALKRVLWSRLRLDAPGRGPCALGGFFLTLLYHRSGYEPDHSMVCETRPSSGRTIKFTH